MLPLRRCFPALFGLLWLAAPASAQSVVSTHAGVVHFFEGTVAIDGTPIQAQFGRFPEIAEGTELRTAQGRAEVLLGSGAMLRVAEDSAIKLISSKLTDVRLELLTGSAILSLKDTVPGNSVVVLYKEWMIRTPKQGVYRIDSDPAQLRVYDGEVEVRAGEDAPATAKAGQTLPLAAVLVPDQTLGAPGDGFNAWAFDRSQAIDADNATAAQIVDDPALYPNLLNASGLSMAGYTYFPPTMGYPYPTTYGSGGYSPWTPYPGGYAYGYGYGYSLAGYGYPLGSAYTLRYLNSGVPGRIILPSLPLRSPTFGGYHPGVGLPATRPGASAPLAPHAAPVVHGGHR